MRFCFLFGILISFPRKELVLLIIWAPSLLFYSNFKPTGLISVDFGMIDRKKRDQISVFWYIVFGVIISWYVRMV